MSGDAARELRAEAEVAAPPDRVWQLLTDLSNMPRWSRETVRMIPLKRGGLRAGQWYLGINRRGRVAWPTRSVVADVDAPRRLVWDTTSSGARWIWELESTESGTRVIHRRPLPGRVPFASRVFAGAFLGGIDHHSGALEVDMQQTVAALKAAAERS